MSSPGRKALARNACNLGNGSVGDRTTLGENVNKDMFFDMIISFVIPLRRPWEDSFQEIGFSG
jgi:hypothetical protein